MDNTAIKNYIMQIMEHSKAVGLVISVFDKSGAVRFEECIGWRDEKNRLPVDADTIFGIASCTKSFTCLAIRMLEECGLLNVNDPVSSYIPELSEESRPGLKIYHLMSHSGGYFPLKRLLARDIAADIGLAADVSSELAYCDELAREGRKRVALQMASQTIKSGLTGLPGEYYSYCNDGFALLSEIIRLVSKKPYAAFIRDEILSPLGMARSTCEFISPALDENSSLLYRDKDGVRICDRDYYDTAHVLNGGGALKSTLNDLKKYVCMYLNEGAADEFALLSEDRLRLMLQPVITYLPGVSYANGLMVRNFGDMNVYGHGGALPGVSSQILFSPEAQLGVVVLCNTSSVPVSLMADAVLRLFAGLPIQEERRNHRAFSWDEAFIKDACGRYESMEGDSFELLRDAEGLLYTTADGERQDVIPIGYGLAVIPGKFSDAKLKFYTRNGKVFAVLRGSRMLPKV